MSKQKISLLQQDDEKSPSIIPKPREFHELGEQALDAIWRVACHLIKDEVNKVQISAKHLESKLEQQYEESLNTIEDLNKTVSGLKLKNDNLTRDNKALYASLEEKNVDLQVCRDKLLHNEDRLRIQTEDFRRALEELGRSKEQATILQKHMDETLNQYTHNQEQTKQIRNELSKYEKSSEGLEANIRHLRGQLEQEQEELRNERQKAEAARSEVDEMRGSIAHYGSEIKELKNEIARHKEAMKEQTMGREESEKKNTLIQGQLEALERAYRESYHKLEQELQAEKSSVMNLRTRMIKSESLAEREAKRAERLESRLLSQNGH